MLSLGTKYVQCLVCGRLTPVDKGICYHCGAPLPSSVDVPKGMVVCPNCLKVTDVATGYCRHCRARLPPELVEEALEEYEALRRSISRARRRRLVLGRVYRVGAIGVLA